jgi:hypothetical protein
VNFGSAFPLAGSSSNSDVSVGINPYSEGGRLKKYLPILFGNIRSGAAILGRI